MKGDQRSSITFIRDLRTTADDFAGTGEWLTNAMTASWDVAAALVDVEGLADVLGERHRIIANDWLAAAMSALTARLLHRAVEILERVDFTPHALREDLNGSRSRQASCIRQPSS